MGRFWLWLRRHILCPHDWQATSKPTVYVSALGMFAHPGSRAAKYRKYSQRDYCNRCGHSRVREWDNDVLND